MEGWHVALPGRQLLPEFPVKYPSLSPNCFTSCVTQSIYICLYFLLSNITLHDRQLILNPLSSQGVKTKSAVARALFATEHSAKTWNRTGHAQCSRPHLRRPAAFQQ
jgi:hypothetical protein